MRITQNMLTQQFLYNITSDNSRMSSLENELSTGKSLNQPSDNPLAVSEDMSINSTVTQTTGFQNTISQGQTWMSNTSAAMSNLNTALQQIQQLVLTGVNGTNTDASAQSALAASAKQFVSDISQIMDSKEGTRYLFGGTAISTSPSSYMFGTSTLAAGASANVSMLVAPGIEIPVNLSASSLMLNTAVGATANLGATLTSIVNDLAAGSQSSLNIDLSNLSAGMTQVTNLESDLGSRQIRMTAVSNQMSQYATLVTNEKGTIEDANMASVITKFNTDQNVYQAALKLGSQILQQTLVSYLP